MAWWQKYIPHPALIAALFAAGIAQLLKPVYHLWRTKHWQWELIFEDGYMPSGHSALITGVTHALGLVEGFHSPLYALALVLSIIILYDAANVRWQTGVHARWLNHILREFLRQEITPQQLLDEVVGHTPWEVFWGVLIGLVTAHLTVALWPW